MNAQSPITDSPWFWVLIFSAMALAALLAMGPKYGGRQARLEVQYQARERIAAERAAGNNAADADRSDHEERRAFASPDDTLIPLWPLAVVLSLVMVLAAAMLVRGRTAGAALSQRQSGSVEGPT